MERGLAELRRGGSAHVALAATREPQHRWRPTTSRLPSCADEKSLVVKSANRRMTELARSASPWGGLGARAAIRARSRTSTPPHRRPELGRMLGRVKGSLAGLGGSAALDPPCALRPSGRRGRWTSGWGLRASDDRAEQAQQLRRSIRSRFRLTGERRFIAVYVIGSRGCGPETGGGKRCVQCPGHPGTVAEPSMVLVEPVS